MVSLTKPRREILVLSVLIITVFLVINLWRDSAQYNTPKIMKLPDAPTESAIKFVAASDHAFSYRLLVFWLQQFDVQSGQYISYRDLDYQKLIDWLGVLNQLEASSQYPELLAARVYSKVADNSRVKLMLEYVYQRFKKDPVKNWRWLAEATITAQHKLKDQTLALKYATALAEEKSEEIPMWAKDIRLIILENMGELEQVRLLIGGLIATKTVTDPHEIRFLDLMMKRIEEKTD